MHPPPLFFCLVENEIVDIFTLILWYDIIPSDGIYRSNETNLLATQLSIINPAKKTLVVINHIL